MITISIVSHNHGYMVNSLIKRLLEFPLISKIIVTLNLPESVAFVLDPRLLYLHNAKPIGFGANHNNAFLHSTTDYFVVLNPDVILPSDPFPELLKFIASKEEIAIIAPLAQSPDCLPDDNWRKYPTFFSLIKKFTIGFNGTYEFSDKKYAFPIDWASGCFLFFKSCAYNAVNGFDETYFMYYEDVDICFRLYRAGFRIYAYPQTTFTHDARRASRRNIRHMSWHARSLIKFQIFLIKSRFERIFS